MTLPMRPDPRRMIDNMQFFMVIMTTVIILLAMVVVWNQNRIFNLEQQLHEIHVEVNRGP